MRWGLGQAGTYLHCDMEREQLRPQHFSSPWKAGKPRGESGTGRLSTPSGFPQRRHVSVDAGCSEVRMPGPLQQAKKRARTLGACRGPSTPPPFAPRHARHRHSVPLRPTLPPRRLAGCSARDGAPQEVQIGGKAGGNKGGPSTVSASGPRQLPPQPPRHPTQPAWGMDPESLSSHSPRPEVPPVARAPHR